jgi:hypothetical protein
MPARSVDGLAVRAGCAAAVLAARAHAPAAPAARFAYFGRSPLKLWVTETDLHRMTGR